MRKNRKRDLYFFAWKIIKWAKGYAIKKQKTATKKDKAIDLRIIDKCVAESVVVKLSRVNEEILPELERLRTEESNINSIGR